MKNPSVCSPCPNLWSRTTRASAAAPVMTANDMVVRSPVTTALRRTGAWGCVTRATLRQLTGSLQAVRAARLTSEAMAFWKLPAVGVVALLLLAGANSSLVRQTGCDSNSHFGLVRAIDVQGQLSIDRYHWQ